MKVNIGDRVRFLNEEGGGRVSRIDGRTVYVEDADGFEIPVLSNDVVVVNEEDERRQGGANYAEKKESTRKKSAPVSEKASWRERLKAEEETEDDEEENDEVVLPPSRPSKPEQKVEPEPERYSFDADATDDTNPHFFLALIRSDGGNTGTLDLYAVNDSNYFASYVLLRIDSKGKANATAVGSIEPNTKEKIDTLNPQQVDGQTWRVQMIMYKNVRTFDPQPVYDVELKPKGAKLYRDGSFVDNDYFDEKALLLPVIKDELVQKIEQLSNKDVNRGASDGRRPEPAKVSKPSNVKGILEVDLHIGQLIENTNGLSNRDMLEVQMNHVKSTLKAKEGQKGLKIIFIHGVGSGVLKAEILKYVSRNYPKYDVQDASFAQYGFGATMLRVN